MRTIVKAHIRTTYSNGQITHDIPHYFLRAVGGDCAVDRIAFNALSDPEKAALATLFPNAAEAKHWIERTCGETAGLTLLLSYADFVADATPPPGTNDLTIPYAFTGTPSGGHRSTDPSVLAMAYDFTGGRIRNLRNTAGRTIPSGYVGRYLINDRWYAFNAGNWYRVNDSAVVSSLATNLSFSPQLGVLVQYYEPPTGRAMSAWRDNPILAASQLVRSL